MSAPDLAAAAKALRESESRLRLLDRAVPQNFASERARLARALETGAHLVPAFRYARLAEAAALRGALLGIARALTNQGPIAELVAERARELSLEAALVEALGTPELPSFSRERFPEPAPHEMPALAELVADYAASPVPAATELFDVDASDPRSLCRILEREIGRSKAAVRIALRDDVVSVAAAGDGVVSVRRGARLSAAEGERVARHELEAHVLPRLAARAEPLVPFRVGTLGAGEDEEGRALLIEERAGLLGGERRRELALRHELARLARAGVPFGDATSDLVSEGVPRERALELTLRAYRGGGLAREIVYLPAFLRVKAAFAEEPELESMFRRGRVSLSGAARLAEYERSAQRGESSITTGVWSEGLSSRRGPTSMRAPLQRATTGFVAKT